LFDFDSNTLVSLSPWQVCSENNFVVLKLSGMIIKSNILILATWKHSKYVFYDNSKIKLHQLKRYYITTNTMTEV
jgi:hypothetical protein